MIPRPIKTGLIGSLSMPSFDSKRTLRVLELIDISFVYPTSTIKKISLFGLYLYENVQYRESSVKISPILHIVGVLVSLQFNQKKLNCFQNLESFQYELVT